MIARLGLKASDGKGCCFPPKFSGTKPVWWTFARFAASFDRQRIRKDQGKMRRCGVLYNESNKIVVLLWKPISFIFLLFQLDCPCLMTYFWCSPKSGFGFAWSFGTQSRWLSAPYIPSKRFPFCGTPHVCTNSLDDLISSCHQCPQLRITQEKLSAIESEGSTASSELGAENCGRSFPRYGRNEF